MRPAQAGQFEIGVDTAKALHLLAPRFFPLWDRAIADAYKLSLNRVGTNSAKYFAFMLICRDQSLACGGEVGFGAGLLKALDQFNYCRFTKGWI